MKFFLIFLFTFSIVAKESVITIKEKSISKKVSMTIPIGFEYKKNFLNTPLLIWNSSLKHHGPSIGLFPIASLGKHTLSKGAVNSNFSKFKSDKNIELKSLNATKVKFGKPSLKKERISYSYSYILPGNLKIISKESYLKCSDGGLKIRSVVKSTDFKKFQPHIDEVFKSLKCKE